MKNKIGLFVLFVVSIFLIIVTEGKEGRTVKTSHGPVRGYKDSETGVFAFYGIPYATAPLRFQAPSPPPLWLSTMEAVDESIVCHQPAQYVQGKTVTENCLIANIYVPDTKEKKVPVVVYVHGGAFFLGNGNLMTPKKLVSTGNVIAVTFNYRLGPHGFLCLGTKNAPGNAGLKDQVALLQWVNRNIEAFGGNPKDVTIAGYSAGASSVDLLMLSPATKNLFHKVIVDSASSLGPAVIMDPIENAKSFARSLNFTDVDDVYALEEFFMTTPLEILTSSATMNSPDSTVTFAPCIERSTNGQEILKEAPANIFKNGKFRRIPVLYGFSNFEGLFRLNDFEHFKVKMNRKFSDFLPANLKFDDDEQKELVAEEVKKFYFSNEPISEKNILRYLEFFGDVLFIYPVLQAVKRNVQAGNEKVYLYEYSFVDEDTPVIPHTDGFKGATHCAQTQSVLDGGQNRMSTEVDISDKLKEMKVIMREFWTNFIKSGEPVPSYSDKPSWPAANSTQTPYMSLNLPPTLQNGINTERVQFWDGIYEKYERLPMPPPNPPSRHSEL